MEREGLTAGMCIVAEKNTRRFLDSFFWERYKNSAEFDPYDDYDSYYSFCEEKITDLKNSLSLVKERSLMDLAIDIQDREAEKEIEKENANAVA
ncbi:hypothetical protein AGMMS50229_08770 [Campylobacterota bacterium]|nr:hypothetical protein AGMMS50229_08770 [Campylobacterota bacterium]